VPSKSVGAIDVDKSGYVSRDDDTDDPDGQGSERKGSDSDACDPGEDDADGLGSERKGSDNDTDDPDGQGSDRKGSDSDVYNPGEDDADGQGSERKGDDGDSERLLQEYQAIAGVKAPGPASNINPEKLEADDTQNLQNLRQQPRRYPARSSQKIPSSVNSKDVDKTGTLYRTVISLPYPYPYRYPDPYPYPLPLPSRSTHVTSP
jgi:hypothetical protein